MGAGGNFWGAIELLPKSNPGSDQSADDGSEEDVDEENAPLFQKVSAAGGNARTSGAEGKGRNEGGGGVGREGGDRVRGRWGWPKWSSPRTNSDQVRGLWLYAAGVTSASVTALSARLMHDEGVAVHWVVLGRATAGLILTSSLLWYKGVDNPLGHRRGVLCLRALFGTCAIYSFFVAASFLPLADAAVPSFVAPLVTTAVAAVALGERPHWGVWAAFPVCMIGAALVVQPSGLFGSTSRSLSGVGVAAAAAQAAFGGVSKVLIRVLSGGLSSRGGGVSGSGGSVGGEAGHIMKEHPLTTMCYTNVVCVVGMTALATWFGSAPVLAREGDYAWVLFLWAASSLSGFSAQLCVTTALGLASASSTAPVHYLGVVWNAGWGYLALGEVPGGIESLGIALITAGSAAATAASLKHNK